MSDAFDALNEAMAMATPVSPSSNLTAGEKKNKASKKAEEAAEDKARVVRPRFDLKSAGGRSGTRASGLESGADK